VDESEHCVVIRDGYPVTPLHTLVITKRHVSDYFELTPDELRDVEAQVFRQRDQIQSTDGSVTGFNVGVNVGVDAGQTVMHCHVHLIPRRKGDVDNPRGGVRGAISGKADY
jgi:diadenosine tetraphosphate (Ap4A) HIT family hydrolase